MNRVHVLIAIIIYAPYAVALATTSYMHGVRDALQIQICSIGLFAMSTRYYHLQMRDYVKVHQLQSIYIYTHGE